MDLEKLATRVEELEKAKSKFAGASPDPKSAERAAPAMRRFAETLRALLVDVLKDLREPIRTGHLFRDAAAKGFVPGDVAGRGDNLLIRWSGKVTPHEPRVVSEDAGHLTGLAERLLPILKAYLTEKEAPKATPNPP